MAKQTKPKYSIGSKVKHTTKNTWGVVVDLFISDDGNGRFIEWRYLVKHSGYVWTVPEVALIVPRDSSRAL